jgi:hypothetical protein
MTTAIALVLSEDELLKLGWIELHELWRSERWKKRKRKRVRFGKEESDPMRQESPH